MRLSVDTEHLNRPDEALEVRNSRHFFLQRGEDIGLVVSGAI